MSDLRRVVSALAFALVLSGNMRAEARPNFLWITVEDMSPHLGCYGDSRVRTPNLDRLASEGIRFTRAFSVSGVCAPSRAAIITGLYPTSFGAQHMRTLSRTASLDKVTDPESLAIPIYEAVPPSEVKCFSEYLRAIGYFCTNNSKTDYQFHAPLTAWDESSGEAHWRNRPAGMPFFSVFNFTTTHESQVWERAEEILRVEPARVELPPYYPDTPVVRRDVARHLTNIELVDEQVGRLLSQLETEGLDDKTVVFFFSDQGDGLPRAKRWLYDSGLRVPLIVRFPDRRSAGAVDGQLVSLVDLAPTMLSLAGLQIPPHLRGQVFLGKGRARPRQFVFASKDRMDPAVDTARAVRDHRYKYIRNYQPQRPFVQFIPYRDQMPLMQELLRLEKEGGLDSVQRLWFRKVKPVEELYDTDADPHEVRDLAAQPEFRHVLERMRSACEDWVRSNDDPLVTPESELVKALWPPDGAQPTTEAPRILFRGAAGSPVAEITCGTAGASLAYRIGSSRWLLYTGPFSIEKGAVVKARAFRIGFKPSNEVTEIAGGGEQREAAVR